MSLQSILEHVHHPQGTPGPVSGDPAPGTHWSTFHLWICLFWSFCVSGITRYVAFFCVWFLPWGFQGSRVLCV